MNYSRLTPENLDREMAHEESALRHEAKVYGYNETWIQMRIAVQKSRALDAIAKVT